MTLKKTVSCRADGSWWLLDKTQWGLISTLRGPEHAFILGVLSAYNLRRESMRRSA